MFEIRDVLQTYRLWRIFSILSLDIFHHFEKYILLPISNNKVSVFAKQVIREHEASTNHIPRRAEQFWQSPEVMKHIYTNGENMLGTKDMYRLVTWINNVAYDNETEHTFVQWQEHLFQLLLESRDIGLDLPKNTIQTIKLIVQKYSSKVDEVERIIDTLEKQGLSEWDKKIKGRYDDRLYIAGLFESLFLLVGVGNLIYSVQIMCAWREITQTINSKELKVFQRWMLNQSQHVNIRESRMDFELVERHMAIMFSD